MYKFVPLEVSFGSFLWKFPLEVKNIITYNILRLLNETSTN